MFGKHNTILGWREQDRASNIVHSDSFQDWLPHSGCASHEL